MEIHGFGEILSVFPASWGLPVLACPFNPEQLFHCCWRKTHSENMDLTTPSTLQKSFTPLNHLQHSICFIFQFWHTPTVQHSHLWHTVFLQTHSTPFHQSSCSSTTPEQGFSTFVLWTCSDGLIFIMVVANVHSKEWSHPTSCQSHSFSCDK
jgi:hypothetical protein